jgi:hypothetical protein
MFIFGSIRSWCLPTAWGLILLALISLEDTNPGAAQAAYDHVWKLFEHGRLADSQREAEIGYKQFQLANPLWASKFQLLEAQNMILRGMYSDGLRLLATYSTFDDPDETILKLAS